MILPPQGVQNAPCEEPIGAGALVKDGDVLGRLPTVLEGGPEVDASFIYGEMGILCERVIFANLVRRSGLL